MTLSEIEDLNMAHASAYQDLDPTYSFRPLQDSRGH